MAPKSPALSPVWQPLLALAACIAYPSLTEVDKYFGLAGAALYAAGVLAAVFVGYVALEKGYARRITRRRSWIIAAGILLGLCALFVVLHPIADVKEPGRGSDSDDALEIAAGELLAGRYPYYARTYLGNEILPQPGAVLLDLPFVLLGNGAAQNLFWLAALFGGLAWWFGDSRLALVLWCAFVLPSPAVFQNIVSGSDKTANSIYVLLAVLGVLAAARAGQPRTGWLLLAGAFLGVALSSRANFLLVAPIVVAEAGRRAGWRQTGMLTLAAALAWALLTLPFLFYDPPAYTPLLAYEKLAQYDPFVPGFGIGVTLLAALTSVTFTFIANNAADATVLSRCAIVQAVAPLAVVLASSYVNGRLDLTLTGYGTNFALLGAFAAFLRLREGARTAAI